MAPPLLLTSHSCADITALRRVFVTQGVLFYDGKGLDGLTERLAPQFAKLRLSCAIRPRRPLPSYGT